MKEDARLYFLVCCKCGHVGRGYFLRLVFPIRAYNQREAAVLGRQHPGVKHDKIDAVLWVEEVMAGEFRRAKAELYKDAYWQGTKKDLAQFIERREREPERRCPDKRVLRKTAVRFRIEKSRIIEAEIRDYIIREYRIAV